MVHVRAGRSIRLSRCGFAKASTACGRRRSRLCASRKFWLTKACPGRCSSRRRWRYRRYHHHDPGGRMGGQYHYAHATRTRRDWRSVLCRRRRDRDHRTRADILSSAVGRSLPRTNGSLPSPSLSDRERLREQVLAQRETVIVEAPVSPSESAHVIGRMNQGKPYELTRDEKQRIMDDYKKGHNITKVKCFS
jgi:hypothetical protein